MVQYKNISLAILGVALLGTAACAPYANSYHDASIEKRNLVQHLRLTEVISFNDFAGGQISPQTQSQIDRFLNINQARYGDSISLDLGAQDDQAAKQKAVKNHLLARGYFLSSQAPITAEAPQDNAGILIIDRYIVTPPNCYEDHNFGKNISLSINAPSHGCATQANLGLMVANPQDLIDPSPLSTLNSEGGVRAVSDYRNALPPKGTQARSPLGSGK